MKFVVAILYLVLAAWAVFVILDSSSMFALQDSAPQQAAVAAWAVAQVALPYVFVRSIEKMYTMLRADD